MAFWRISPRLATTALLSLVVLDIALIGTALKSTQSNAIDTSPLSSAPPSSTSPSESADPSPTTSSTGDRAPLQTMLVALDDKRAWRVVAGSCSAGGATLATTADGGQTWTKGKATLRRIVRLRLDGAQSAFVIGANSSCVAELRDTTDGGSTWASGGTAERAWFRDPKSPLVVWAPGPATSKPCGQSAVLDLAVLATESARVLCADGRVRSTVNNGVLWKDGGKVDGAVAMAVPTVKPAETYVARLDSPDCAGVQILRVRQQVATSCIKATIPKGPGQISMSLVAGGGWLAVGDATMRSTDGLVTWSAS
jgi:hypothetical protein